MSADADRKLEALESVLDGRQRAILAVRSWMANEPLDDRVTRYCPPQYLAEFEAVLKTLGRGNTQLVKTCHWLYEWIAQTESDIHWLRVLDMYQSREKQIPNPIRRGLGKFPSVWDMRRKAHRGFGRGADNEPSDCSSWEEFRERQVNAIRESSQARWQDYLRGMRALEEAAEALGTDVTHFSVRDAFDDLRGDVLHLVALFRESGHEVELPELDWEPQHYARDLFAIDVLRSKSGEKHARERLSEAALAELEEWERKQAFEFDDE